MKLIVVLCLVAVAVAAPPARVNYPQDNVQLISYDSDNADGNYSYSDGQRRNEDGELRNAGAEDEFVAVKGSYSWIGPDGVNHSVNYIADENGYQPKTQSHLGIPSAIIATLLS